MREFYKEQREKRAKESVITGIVMTLAVHAVAIGVGFACGMTYLDPPPPEKEEILIEFEQTPEERQRHKMKVGNRPTTEIPDKTRKEQMVKASEAPVEGSEANEGKETRLGENGDVAVKEPPVQDTIKTRALFSTAKNRTDKDTLAAQTAREVTDALKTGHASGNVKNGPTNKNPNIQVEGVTVIGEMVMPSYPVKEDGVVVVDITVDANGKVVEVIIGQGTTATNKALWKAAEKAVRETRFKPEPDGRKQVGKVTYKFKIN